MQNKNKEIFLFRLYHLYA